MTVKTGISELARRPLPSPSLRRLKRPAMRQSRGPELLLTAKTQRWPPEEVLRTLVEAEVACPRRLERRPRQRRHVPVVKTIDGVRPQGSSIHRQRGRT